MYDTESGRTRATLFSKALYQYHMLQREVGGKRKLPPVPATKDKTSRNPGARISEEDTFRWQARKCLLRFPFSPNVAGQSSHANGRSFSLRGHQNTKSTKPPSGLVFDSWHSQQTASFQQSARTNCTVRWCCLRVSRFQNKHMHRQNKDILETRKRKRNSLVKK
jgi:hypothetical protein